MDSERIKITSSSILPKGWNWEEYEDGSGCLKSPDNESYFDFDTLPYYKLGGIEYLIPLERDYSIYWGVLSEFKAYAEVFVATELKNIHGSKQKFNDSGKVFTLNTALRKNCPMYHESGNCMSAGVNCATISDYVCKALHKAHDLGADSLLL